MGEFALGQPVPRFEDPRLLRGGGRYVDDMVLPRMEIVRLLCVRDRPQDEIGRQQL